jgi:hypothetical protein
MEERPQSTAELVDRMTSRIVNTLVIAAGIIGLAIYARPGPPRYEIVAAPDGRIYRVNRSNGSIVTCDSGRCMIVYRSGHDLDHVPRQQALPAPAPPAAPNAPAQPTAPAQPSAQR